MTPERIRCVDGRLTEVLERGEAAPAAAYTIVVVRGIIGSQPRQQQP